MAPENGQAGRVGYQGKKTNQSDGLEVSRLRGDYLVDGLHQDQGSEGGHDRALEYRGHRLPTRIPADDIQAAPLGEGIPQHVKGVGEQGRRAGLPPRRPLRP